MARGWADSHSNLELSVFWRETPSEADCQAARERLEALPLRPYQNGRWLERGELNRVSEIVERDYSDKLVQPDYTADESYELARQKSRVILAGGPPNFILAGS